MADNHADDAELLKLGDEFEKRWTLHREALRAMEQLYSEETDERCEAACDSTSDIVAQIQARQAHTLAGLKLKARVFTWCRGDDELSDTTLNDQGTGDVCIAVGIIRDLLALTGLPGWAAGESA